MKYRRTSRFLSIVLLVAMVLTLMPTAAFAEDNATTTWIQTTLADITSGDTVAITMSKDGNTWLLPTSAQNQPLAVSATVEGNVLTANGTAEDFGWKIIQDDGSFVISGPNGALYIRGDQKNNGVRIGDTTAVWTIAENGLPTTEDLAGVTRYMGVYNGQDWRAYEMKNGTVANVGGQTFGVWKLDGGGTIDPTEPTTPPVEPEDPTETASFVKLDASPADGEQVLIFNPGSAVVMGLEDFFYNNTKHELAPVTAALGEDGKLTPAEGYALLTVKLNADGKYSFVNQDGKFLEVDGTNAQFVESESANTLFQLEEAEGGYYVKCNTAEFNGRAQYLQYYYNYFTVYSLNTNYPERYVFAFYKEADGDEPVTPTEPPVEPAYSTIAEALEASEGEFTVKGVVTLLDNKNVYLQDATGGICLYLTAAPTDLALGDTVIGTGSRTVYRGLPELGSATYEKSSGLTLTAKETSIGALTTADVCTYVKLTGLTVTEVYDNNGAYSAPNITVKDENGGSIQIYKAAVGKTDGVWDVAVDDVIDFTGAVGINNSTLQLRNTLTSEISRKTETKTGLVTDLADLTDGARVVILNPANQMALSQEYSGNYNKGVAITLTDGVLAGYGATEIWTVGVNEDGTYTFATAEGKKLSMGESYSSLPLDEVNPNWKVIAAEGSENGFYIENTGRENMRIEWYADKNNWSAYYKNNTGDLFIQQFYLVPEGGDTPVEPAGNTYGLASKLNDGDTVILYNAANKVALGNTVASHKITGVSLTPENGVITTDEEAVAWTVTVNADGTYTFKQGEKTLGGVVSGTYNNLVPTDATFVNWTLTGPDAEDFNYYLYLGEMESSYGNVYLEYYNGFTLYGSSADKVNKNAYGITFYKQGAEAETPSGGEEPVAGDIAVGTLVTSLDQLADGATVLIYSPTHKTAASSVPNGDWYIKAEGPITDSFTAPLVWTVTKNADGSYRFANGENILSAWPSGNYVELTVNAAYNSETVSDWNIAQCNAATHTWYISSTTLQVNNKTAYVEAYTRNGGEVFSGYATNSPSEDNYGLQFYLVDPADASTETDDGTWDGVLTKGAQYVVYNASAEGVLGIPNDMGNALTLVSATIEGGKAKVANGAMVFTVADNPGRYYVFEAGGKYLATNNAEELFFKDEIDEYTKWYLTKNGSGYLLYNKTANYNGTPVCIEFFSGSFSGWTFKSTDADIFRFNFYPVADGTAVVNGVAQVPTVNFACEDSRYIEQDYEVKFSPPA